MAQIDSIADWHRTARPHPDARALSVQIGCHLEEVAEMLAAMTFYSEESASRAMLARRLANMVNDVAVDLKAGVIEAKILNRKEVLDSLCDQIVTSVGVGVCAGMNMPDAVTEVDRSNWSKFIDGEAVFDNNGKIIKSPVYSPPSLNGMY